ncbi:peptidoglycan binding domain-containing protein [Streptomyces sp. NPDC001985]|uniref:hypothetical protein n=1 Tax=Streptomyces sp. NPDC001985 TaxID=3154406 RepID=UPI0033223108
MSRETDSSSSGPQGRGGAAYPSGTPPYGSRQYPSQHPAQDAPDGAGAGGADGSAEPGADGARTKSEPKTETTLTTRIRINIPGSRPIPPVVMRKPMGDAEAGASAPVEPGAPGAPRASAERDPERTAAMPVIGGPRAPSVPAPAREPQTPPPAEKPSGNDWFAPRRGTNGAGIPSPAAGSASGAAAGSGPGSGSVPAPGTDGAGIPSPAGSPDASQGRGLPGAPGGTAPAPREPDPLTAPLDQVEGAQGAASGPQGTPPGQTYFADAANRPAPAAPRPRSALRDLAAGAAATSSGGATGFAPGGGSAPAGPAEPTGATSGPARGTMPVRGRPAGDTPGTPAAPGAPRLSDDTAVLTPQKLVPEPANPAGPGGQVSGDTLTSGIPVVPAARTPKAGGDFAAPGAPGTPGGPGATGPGGTPTPAAAPAPAPRPAPPAAKKKGRSKLVLLGAAVVGLAGITYGAGLLLNHSEVPKSTTVLGVDIGGGTKEQAVVKLEQALGKRAATPLQLTVGDKKEQLAPDKAGLVLDTQATVRKAAGSDYNPVSVIGSLFGDARVVEPEIPVDEEKLSVALSDLAGESGSVVEGTITFEPGKVIPVPGKAGQTLDVARSMISVKDAFRAQVATGRPNAVTLPVAKREPAVGQAEVERAMKEFAEPAMSGLITIKAGGRGIDFGPAISLPRILSMKPVDGKLVEVYDKKAIEELLGGTFEGVLITKGDGKQHQLNADDVAQAMGPALRGKTPQERTVEIPLGG